jgi:hypothetical protein
LEQSRYLAGRANAMNAQSVFILALTILLSLVRCTAIEEIAPTRAFVGQSPQFVALLGHDEQNYVTIELGIVNRDARAMEAQEDMQAAWRLVGPDGSLRAGGTLEHLPYLASGEAVFPLHWSDDLEPGHYTLTWGCPELGIQETGFLVLEHQGKRALLLDHS